MSVFHMLRSLKLVWLYIVTAIITFTGVWLLAADIHSLAWEFLIVGLGGYGYVSFRLVRERLRILREKEGTEK